MPEEFAKKIPAEFLEKLSEYTYGGYLLFYFDTDGEPCVESHGQEPTDTIALRKLALDILQMMDKANREVILEELRLSALLENMGDSEDSE